jgi:endonuclease/exonuclease/phosphatase family metal-dependent hydrolase
MLRLVTWNCRIGGFRYKAAQVAQLRPDLLAVQEVEPLEQVMVFGGQHQPTYRDRLGDPAFPRRAIGVFSYTGLEIRAVDQEAPLYSFRRCVARRADLEFNVIAVWTAATNDKATAYRQAHEGIEAHRDWIRERPTVLLGDLNDNASYRGTRWTDLMALLQPLGLFSAYHAFYSEAPGSETQPTHFYRGVETARFHVDYCFLPAEWRSRIEDVIVGAFLPSWKKTSDHVPLVVDLDL